MNPLREADDMSILEVRNVNKNFAGLKALNEVNLTVEEGTVHAII